MINDEPGLRLRMHRLDAHNCPYTEEWFCDIPPHAAEYRVTRSEWNADYSVRRILEVELTGA